MGLLSRAKNNRYYCTCCGKNIKNGEKFFHDGKSSGIRFSHTVNICYRCITGMFLQSDVPQDEVNTIRDEIMINKIEGDE